MATEDPMQLAEARIVRPSNQRFQFTRATAIETPVVFDIHDAAVSYGAFRAVRDVTMKVHKNQITAFIGPSGCGKTTMLRALNRMHDETPGARVTGKLEYLGVD